ncbi:DUF2339 domain-containing protein [Putridiphycobacter roseus]|uniref:DUF2339 domain-containing protein n=1 Tax=Putridiphycobacter roseus TaxID=2219161 RepID=A0A2W1N3P8_9FLAO|nr:DUF2339 domain-containing protein [Putridiphycobacter roseus]PZE18474.1 DUF2339 domain-containing protein [Putridiphycobacter roseus]
MESNKDRIELLENRMRILLRRQNTLNEDLLALQEAINELKTGKTAEVINPVVIPTPVSPAVELVKETEPTIAIKEDIVSEAITKESTQKAVPKIKTKSSLEKFIGENLISKIGIVILVIGVGIGAKYAIEHELISPLTRIILAYLVGVALLGTAIVLKKKYENFSAVILSGSVAIFYIITYLAYSLYGLLPQVPTFILLLVYTIFTVIAAIQYNKQVIALYGLVGAYAIPFLLSSGSGRFDIFFSYITIVNIGILCISILRYWKGLFYSAFVFTWLIFAAWLFKSYQIQFFNYGMIFSSIFFILFYASFILYKIVKSELFSITDVLLIISNTFIYFFIGIWLLDDYPGGERFLGAFTVLIAIINFLVAYLFYKKKTADKKLFYFTIGLVFVFITIAIPVQFDGYVVTNLWAAIALVLFWIGRRKNIIQYEWISYPIFILAFCSLANDWSNYYGYFYEEQLQPIFNISFLSNLLFIASLGIASYLIYTVKLNEEKNRFTTVHRVAQILIPSAMVFVAFNIGRLELFNYFDIAYQNSALIINQTEGTTTYNHNLLDFRKIWFSIYVLLFAITMTFLNKIWLKIKTLSYVNIVILTLSITLFLTAGLYSISELRFNYLNAENNYFVIGSNNIIIRYFAILVAAFAMFILRKKVNTVFPIKIASTIVEITTHTFILWILSSELIHLLDMAHSNVAYKLSLSILWGTYALFLVALGIWKQNAPLRIIGIALFGITLIKLFFYDIAHLNTISKTIVFLALGVLLLIISFLYNKFKHKISIDE